MDYLWTPWRYTYLASSGRTGRRGVPEELAAWPGDLDCVFCNMLAAVRYAEEHGMAPAEAERAAGIVLSAHYTYICLNRFPYNSGHIMIVSYTHTASLAELETAAAEEIMALAQQTEKVYEKVYHPEGMNLGINLGRSAGAGVAGHLHMHALPRWTGDANFMTVTAETRVLPETLGMTWERLRHAFGEIAEPGSRSSAGPGAERSHKS